MVEKIESENADVDPVVVDPKGVKELVENAEPVEGVVVDEEPPVTPEVPFFEKENSDATLAIFDGPAFKELVAKLNPVGCV